MPRPQSIFPGEKYGQLTILERSKERPRYFICRCECGKTTTVFSSHLKQGRTISCGCYHKKIVSQNMKRQSTKHAMYGTPTYNVWASMINRCHNPKSKAFKDYGGRGIHVCPEWRNFEKFFADMGQANGLTIERRNNEHGYSKNNCYWASMKVQANNRRSNVRITFNGKTQNISQWAKELNIPRSRLYDRLRRENWPIEKALSTP